MHWAMVLTGYAIKRIKRNPYHHPVVKNAFALQKWRVFVGKNVKYNQY
jgi:hypothetical protein